jgi:hypothetical protein
MARETRLLLGLLGLLAGLFVGVVSLKLLVPRPPEGVGPDVHGDVAFTVRQALVPPPVRGPRAADFAAAPPLVGSMPGSMPLASPFGEASPRLADAFPVDAAGLVADEPAPSRFASAPPVADLEPFDAVPATADPFVRPAAFAEEEPARPEPAAAGSRFARPASEDGATEPGITAFPLPDEPPDEPTPAMMPRQADPSERPLLAATTTPDARPPLTRAPIAGSHVVAPGDSWWSLAERAYGDGRLYRALYAWNRSRDPRMALVPGTSLEVPPIERLAASWPALVPAGR